jgi:hypothetical protein
MGEPRQRLHEALAADRSGDDGWTSPGPTVPGKDIVEPLGEPPGEVRIRIRSFADALLAEIVAPPVTVTEYSNRFGTQILGQRVITTFFSV